jgi:hypothetical protein
LTVDNTFIRTPGEYGWIEGAVAEVVLKSADGTGVTMRGSLMTFPDLQPGRYTVRPAARPCDGNCGYLDARTGECEAVVQVPTITRLTVQHTAGRACTIQMR